MEVHQLLDVECVLTDMENLDKHDALRTMIQSCPSERCGVQKKKILEAVWERECLGSTAVGRGVAFPHARAAFIKKTTLMVGISKNGLNFGALDNSKTHAVFLLLLPSKTEVNHLGLISKLVTLFLNPSMLKGLLELADKRKIIDYLSRISRGPARKEHSPVAAG